MVLGEDTRGLWAQSSCVLCLSLTHEERGRRPYEAPTHMAAGVRTRCGVVEHKNGVGVGLGCPSYHGSSRNGYEIRRSVDRYMIRSRRMKLVLVGGWQPLLAQAAVAVLVLRKRLQLTEGGVSVAPFLGALMC